MAIAPEYRGTGGLGIMLAQSPQMDGYVQWIWRPDFAGLHGNRAKY